MLIGYARVSTKDQDTALQEDALRKAGVERIFIEKASGAREDRPELAKMLETTRQDDTIVVWKLDRLARSIRHIITLSDTMNARGIHLKSLTDNLDTSTASGELTFHVLAALAQFERGLIRERVVAGLEAAWASGSKSGRKPADPAKIEKALAYMKKGLSVEEAARAVGLARATVYKHITSRKIDKTNTDMNKQTKLNGGNAATSALSPHSTH